MKLRLITDADSDLLARDLVDQLSSGELKKFIVELDDMMADAKFSLELHQHFSQVAKVIRDEEDQCKL